jgi:hypothetical protein
MCMSVVPPGAVHAVLHATYLLPMTDAALTRHGAHAPTSRRDEMRGAQGERAISGLRYTARRHAHRRIVQALDYRTDRCTL